MLLTNQARSLLGVTRVLADIDMIFVRSLTPTERTDVEALVLKWFNERNRTPLAKAAGWSQREATREDFDFEGGWTSDDRFETVNCFIAELLFDTGGIHSLFHFLINLDLIAPLEEVWLFVEASIDWLTDWTINLEGDFGHYLESAYITFEEPPNESERVQIEQIFGFDSEDKDEFSGDGIWSSDETFTLRIILDIEPEYLLSQLNAVQEIVPVKVVGIGVIVPL